MVDHLDEEAVGDGVEHFRDVHRDGYGSAWGLALIEARDHPSRDGEQGRCGGMPWFEAMLVGASSQRLHYGREDELLQDLHCRDLHSCWAELAVNCLLKARAIAFVLEWVFPSKVIDLLGEGSNSCLLACAVGTSGSVVGGFQKGSPLVLRILADEQLDVLVLQLDGRVEWVFSAALISLRDEGSHNFGERTAVIPVITRGDMVSSVITEDLPEDFFIPQNRRLVEGYRRISSLILLCNPPSQPCGSS